MTARSVAVIAVDFGRLTTLPLMPTISDTAICIRHWDFSETSQTVGLFTRRHGILRGLAKGAKREKGGFSGGIDLLHRADVVAIVKDGRELATITEWHLAEVFRAVIENIRANRIGLYMADIVSRMLQRDDPHPALFDHMVADLRKLTSEQNRETALLDFQFHLLRECGYEPRLTEDSETGKALPDDQTLAFSATFGGVVADTGGQDRWRVRRETVLLLQQLAVGDPIKGDPAIVNRANALLAAYLREIIGEDLLTRQWLFQPDKPARQ